MLDTSIACPCLCVNPIFKSIHRSFILLPTCYVCYTQVSPGDSLPQWTACLPLCLPPFLAGRLEEEEEPEGGEGGLRTYGTAGRKIERARALTRSHLPD